MARRMLREEVLAARRERREQFANRMSVQRRLAREKVRQGAYLLPSLLTVGSILMSFSAVIGLFSRGSMSYQTAAWMLFGAFVLDGLDGKVARLTGTSSEFGIQLDSLADVISFGVAPSLLVYSWALEPFGRLGWIMAFLFLVCGACRLARFNVQTVVAPDKRYFTGLPIPVAALTLASIVLNVPHVEKNGWFSWMILGLVGILSYLMVSKVRYRSFKDVDFRRQRSPRMVAIIAVILGFIAYQPQPTILLGMSLFVISGPLGAILSARSSGQAKKPAPALGEVVPPADLESPKPEEPKQSSTSSSQDA